MTDLPDELQDTRDWVRYNIAPILLWAPDWPRIVAWLRLHPAYLEAVTGGSQVSPNHREGARVCTLIADDNPEPLTASLEAQLYTKHGLQGEEMLGYVGFWLPLWLAAYLYLAETGKHPHLCDLLRRAITASLALLTLHYHRGHTLAPGARRGWPAQNVEGMVVEILAERVPDRKSEWWGLIYHAAPRLLLKHLDRHLVYAPDLMGAATLRVNDRNHEEADEICRTILADTPLRWPIVWTRYADGWTSRAVDLGKGAGWWTDPVDAVSTVPSDQLNQVGSATVWPAPPGASRLEDWAGPPLWAAEYDSGVMRYRRRLPHGTFEQEVENPAGLWLHTMTLGRPEAIFGPPKPPAPPPPPNPAPPTEPPPPGTRAHHLHWLAAHLDAYHGIERGTRGPDLRPDGTLMTVEESLEGHVGHLQHHARNL